MDTNKRIILTTQLILIFPAALFLIAVAARYLHPLHDAAQQIVTWYSVRSWTLWVLLIALPFAALLAGCAALLWNAIGGNEESHARLPARIIAAVTLAAGLILAIVALHMLAT